MENTTDTLQIEIDKARALLSPEARESIDAVNWKIILLEIGDKLNPEQLSDLEIETELLLCGILSPMEYEKELEKRLKMNKEDISILLKQMDEMIFQKMQQELEKKIKRQDIKIPTPQKDVKEVTFDPQFNSLPQSVQKAIADSNWKEKLYSIAPKYNLNVEQMGILENTTIRFIKNEINQNQYENSLASDLKIEKEKLINLINDINNNILKNIRENMRNQNQSTAPIPQEKIISKEKDEEEIPLPPYGINNKKQVESSKEDEGVQGNEKKEYTPTNMFEEKLYVPTSSNKTNTTYHKDSPDPYREPL